MSVSPVAVTNPLPPAPMAIEGDAHAAVEGNIRLVSRLSAMFWEMIMVDAAVVTVSGLVLLLLSSPPYYDLRVTSGTWILKGQGRWGCTTIPTGG
jgi:hypothetical protein